MAQRPRDPRLARNGVQNVSTVRESAHLGNVAMEGGETQKPLEIQGFAEKTAMKTSSRATGLEPATTGSTVRHLRRLPSTTKLDDLCCLHRPWLRRSRYRR